jgi:hypothetical protein
MNDYENKKDPHTYVSIRKRNLKSDLLWSLLKIGYIFSENRIV